MTDALRSLLHRHRSIRSYLPQDVPPELLGEVLADSIRGSSSSGNLNTYSVIVSRDAARRDTLCALHQGQDMVRQAPVVLTFCADARRTRDWLALNGARDNFDNFMGFMVAAFDAVILAQTVSLALEDRGLGICYMGTTLNQADRISDLLELPPGVLPVTSLVVGWPDEAPDARDRLPLAAYVHEERYQRHDDEVLRRLYAAREERGRQRYHALGPEMAALWAEHGIHNLAQFYTSPIKYSPEALREVSHRLLALLPRQDFMNHPPVAAAVPADPPEPAPQGLPSRPDDRSSQ